MFISASSYFFYFRVNPCTAYKYVFEIKVIYVPELILNYILFKSKSKSPMNIWEQ